MCLENSDVKGHAGFVFYRTSCDRVEAQSKVVILSVGSLEIYKKGGKQGNGPEVLFHDECFCVFKSNYNNINVLCII